jgi:CheY-like chemotaxis protein
VNVISFRVEENRQKLTINIDKNIPKTLIGDDQRLAQVIANLLGNAVKFTPEDGFINLDARFEKEENGFCTIRISVTDSGIGISGEHQGKLFRSFQQAESNTARKYGGTGLGLAISKNIVELMGGTIWVQSEPGKGSAFAFTIKAKRGEGKQEPAERPMHNSDVRQNDKIFTGRRILLAEDVEINREIVLSLFESMPVEIDCAENGLDAVRMFSEAPEKYDMILMDVQMPTMDGYEATRQIRAIEAKLKGDMEFPSETPKQLSERPKGVPIIAMTANVFREDIDKCMEAGMNDHIGKPLDFDVVLEKMRIYLSGSMRVFTDARHPE